MSAPRLRRGPASPSRVAVTPSARPATAARLVPPAAATVMVVEDDPEERALFTSFLAHAGYDVVDVADAAAALLVMRDRRAHVDVLVTDVVLPHVDGPALVAAVREHHPAVRVLYVSGYDVETEAALAGAAETRHATKPLTRSALLAEVGALLAPPAAGPPRREVASEFD